MVLKFELTFNEIKNCFLITGVTFQVLSKDTWPGPGTDPRCLNILPAQMPLKASFLGTHGPSFSQQMGWDQLFGEWEAEGGKQRWLPHGEVHAFYLELKTSTWVKMTTFPVPGIHSRQLSGQRRGLRLGLGWESTHHSQRPRRKALVLLQTGSDWASSRDGGGGMPTAPPTDPIPVSGGDQTPPNHWWLGNPAHTGLQRCGPGSGAQQRSAEPGPGPPAAASAGGLASLCRTALRKRSVIIITESHFLIYQGVYYSCRSSGSDWDLKHNFKVGITICNLTLTIHVEKQKWS